MPQLDIKDKTAMVIIHRTIAVLRHTSTKNSVDKFVCKFNNSLLFVKEE